jgi:hypothetical protein
MKDCAYSGLRVTGPGVLRYRCLDSIYFVHDVITMPCMWREVALKLKARLQVRANIGKGNYFFFFAGPITLVSKSEWRRASLILKCYQTLHSCDLQPFLNEEQQLGLGNPQLYYPTRELHTNFKDETRKTRNPSHLGVDKRIVLIYCYMYTHC